jgi:hypothetical protein
VENQEGGRRSRRENESGCKEYDASLSPSLSNTTRHDSITPFRPFFWRKPRRGRLLRLGPAQLEADSEADNQGPAREASVELGPLQGSSESIFICVLFLRKEEEEKEEHPLYIHIHSFSRPLSYLLSILCRLQFPCPVG